MDPCFGPDAPQLDFATRSSINHEHLCSWFFSILFLHISSNFLHSMDWCTATGVFGVFFTILGFLRFVPHSLHSDWCSRWHFSLLRHSDWRSGWHFSHLQHSDWRSGWHFSPLQHSDWCSGWHFFPLQHSDWCSGWHFFPLQHSGWCLVSLSILLSAKRLLFLGVFSIWEGLLMIYSGYLIFYCIASAFWNSFLPFSCWYV